ncbi:MAG: hypothetical protein GF418_07685 [Chitinivibrionales bacterium]|nr:hypothetical protein [Chitinivibrionales bacterium]MBD3395494.1 hypothetical protein [Chitinivibrionales bacterium]
MTWSKLNAIIEQNTSFLVSSHISPDGDCIGSQLACYWLLAERGKDVVVYNADPVPRKLSFLPGAQVITTTFPRRTFDVLIVLDASNRDRLGWDSSVPVPSCVVNIDHHQDNTAFGDCNILDSTVAATGQILYALFSDAGISYPPHVAQALYAAIMTDTGGFRFSNTTGTVLRTCADLADRGADCAEVYRHLYASDSQNGLTLKARIWSTLAFHLGGRVCTMELPMGLINEVGAEYGDSEGMADFTITAEGVEVGMLIKYNERETHFSMRSTGRIDVGSIARSIPGGGGHMNAAGCTLYLPLPDAMRRLLAILEGTLE